MKHVLDVDGIHICLKMTEIAMTEIAMTEIAMTEIAMTEIAIFRSQCELWDAVAVSPKLRFLRCSLG
jgi:hypothetical protein